MIIYFDSEGRWLGSIGEGYPAPAEAMQNVARAQPNVLDVPPVDARFWYRDPKDGAFKERPRLSLTVSAPMADPEGSLVTIAGIPAGTTVHVVGPNTDLSAEADDDPLEIVMRQAGTYQVSFERFPYVAEAISFATEAAHG